MVVEFLLVMGRKLESATKKPLLRRLAGKSVHILTGSDSKGASRKILAQSPPGIDETPFDELLINTTSTVADGELRNLLAGRPRRKNIPLFKIGTFVSPSRCGNPSAKNIRSPGRPK